MGVTLKSRIPEIVAEIPAGVGEAIHHGTEEIAKGAADRAPVETGELRDSIQAGANSQGFGIMAAWYWFFAEFGTTHESARPFMIPATEAGKDELTAEVRAVLEKL